MNQVEEIYGKKVVRGKNCYYVKFRGRPESENAWVEAENIENIEEVLERFEKKNAEEVSVIRKRKGSFSNSDEVKRVVQVIWDTDNKEAMGEVEWKSGNLYNGVYPLMLLHEKCPREMCEIYYSLLKFTYTP
jgi:hypothetical protein